MIVMTCLCKTSELLRKEFFLLFSFFLKKGKKRETKILPINTLGYNVHKKKNPSARLRRRVSVVVCGLAMTFPNRKKIFEQNRLFLSLSLLSLVLSFYFLFHSVSRVGPRLPVFFWPPPQEEEEEERKAPKNLAWCECVCERVFSINIFGLEGDSLAAAGIFLFLLPGMRCERRVDTPWPIGFNG